MKTQFKHLLPTFALACALWGPLPAAQAGVVTLLSQAAFNAALPGGSSDGFNDLVSGQALGTTVRGTGALAYQATVQDTTGAGAANGGNDLFTVDAGGGNIWLSTAVAGNALVFSGFDPSVHGIGGSFFGTDVDGLLFDGQSFLLTLTDVVGATTSYALNSVTGSAGFVGFVSTESIASLTVLALQPAGADPGNPRSYSYATADNLTIGGAAAVPEPSSVALALLALAAAGAARRRCR